MSLQGVKDEKFHVGTAILTGINDAAVVGTGARGINEVCGDGDLIERCRPAIEPENIVDPLVVGERRVDDIQVGGVGRQERAGAPKAARPQIVAAERRIRDRHISFINDDDGIVGVVTVTVGEGTAGNGDVVEAL